METLNSLLHLPKIDTGCAVVTGSFAFILASYFKEHKVRVISCKPVGKWVDEIQVEYQGKQKTLVLTGSDSANKIGKRIGIKGK